jgi:hypothetical protein
VVGKDSRGFMTMVSFHAVAGRASGAILAP